MTQELVLITTSDLARALGVDVSTVRRWVSSSKITPSLTTPGGHHRFDLSQVREQLRALAEGGEQQ
jgi:excisionase family DNA binding protein